MESGARIVGTAGNSIGLIAALRERLTVELGLSYETIDALAGWGSTYATKLLGPEPGMPKNGNGWRPTARSLGPMSLDILLGVACVRLVLVEDEVALARLQKHRDFVPRKRPMRARAKHDYIVRRDTWEHMRQMGRAGGLARKAKLSAKRRTASARKAAKARWHKPSAEAHVLDTSPATAPPSPAPATRRPRAAGIASQKGRARPQ